ncbi:MAG: hypothetical protein ACK4XK_09515, partial [Casimicrobiaceae bacterium]
MRDRRCLEALLLTCVLCLPIATSAAEELVVTLRERESVKDQRGNYFNEAIQLALEKTVSSHGPYRLQRTPPMNKERSLLDAMQRAYPNLVVTAGPSEVKGLRLVPVPVPP